MLASDNPRRGRRLVVVTVMALLLAACFDTAESGAALGDSGVASLEGIVSLPEDFPAGQQEAFADGEITVEEYSAAFGSWVECSEAAGGRVIIDSRHPATGLISYGTSSLIGPPGDPSNSSGVGRCYDETFSWIDLVFQVTDPAVLAQSLEGEEEFYLSFVRKCLLENGIEAPEDAAPGSASYGELLSEYMTLSQQGKCS